MFDFEPIVAVIERNGFDFETPERECPDCGGSLTHKDPSDTSRDRRGCLYCKKCDKGFQYKGGKSADFASPKKKCPSCGGSLSFKESEGRGVNYNQCDKCGKKYSLYKSRESTDFANPNCPTCGKFTKYYHSVKHGRVLGCKSCNKTYKHKGETNKGGDKLGAGKDKEQPKAEKVEGTTEKGLEASPKKDFSTDSDGYAPARGGKGKDWVTHDDYDENTPAEKEKKGGIYFQNKPRLAGYFGRHWGMTRKDNPFKPHQQPQHKDWHEGWDDHEYINSEKKESKTEDFSGHTPGSLFKLPKYDQPFKLDKIVGTKAYMTHPKLGPASVSVSNLGKMSPVNPPPIPALTPKSMTKTQIPSLNMQDYSTDFAKEMGDTLESIHSEDSPESLRKGLRTKNAGMYESDPAYRGNVDKVAKSMSTIGAWMKDKDFDPKLRNSATIEEHLKKLMDLSIGKHATAIQHGYALANPTEVEGKLGYPGSASEAISRHIGRLHSDYYAADHPSKEVPAMEESQVIPPFARSLGTPRGDFKAGLDQITKNEKHKGPFIRHLLHRMPEHFAGEIHGSDSPTGDYTSQAERLEKLRGGGLDQGKMEKLLTAMHREHGPLTQDQLYNHVLPNLPYKIPSDNEKDNINTEYGSITPKAKAAMLRSEKMAKVTAEEAKGKIPQKVEALKSPGADIPVNRHTKKPYDNYDPLVKTRVAHKLTPGNRFETDGAVYGAMGPNIIGLPGKGDKAYVTLEKRSGNPQAAKNIHIPWDKIEKFIEEHHVAHAIS